MIVNKTLLFGAFLVLLGANSINVTAQTKFKERVSITVNQKTTPDSLLSIFGQSEFYSIKGLTVMIKKTRDKTIELELKAGQQHIVEQEKSYSGQKHILRSDSIVTKDTTLVFTVKESYSTVANIDNGRYVANLHTSNDTLYINFWLDVINDSTYYQVQNPDKYNWDFLPTEQYFITLKNRQSMSFWGYNWEIAAVTLPFKLHFGYSDTPYDFNTAVNISSFIGKRYSRFNYRYDTYEKMKKSDLSFSVGAVIGISSMIIDTTNTNESTLEQTNAPILSLGFGGIFNLRDFNLGVFGGYDFGIGTTASKWDFHRRPWLGFGFGYKIALFGNP